MLIWKRTVQSKGKGSIKGDEMLLEQEEKLKVTG